ncbi:cupin domain-containing protein [Candidatus Latescibacterota bacterium]
MPIKKINEFQGQDGGVLLSGNAEGKDLMPEMSVHFMTLKPGNDVSPHVHDRVEVYVFLSGKAKVMTGDEIKEVSTGDVAIAPIGTPHAIQVLGNEPLLFYALNSPPASTCPMEAASEEIIAKFAKTSV